MIRLLIVDDEDIERNSMEMILARAIPDLTITQAKNGKSAIEQAVKLQPDLVLMDIKMPGMSGLEAIKEIKGRGISCQFILVTAYDTFDYAKQAIRMGVKDYLLKPSKVSEIVATVEQVIDQIKVDKKVQAQQSKQQLLLEKSRRVLETDMVIQLLFDHVHDVNLTMLLEMLEIKALEQMFVMVFLLPEGLENQYPALVERIKRMAPSAWVGSLYGRQFPVIVFRNREKTYRAQATEIARNCLKGTEKTLEKGWFIGIGQVYEQLDDLKKSYHEALVAMMDTKRPVKYRFYQDVEPGIDQTDQQLDHYRDKAFFDDIRLGKWDNISQQLVTLIQCYQNEQTDLVKVQQRILEMIWMMALILDEMHISIKRETISLHSQTYQQLIEEVKRYFDQIKERYQTYQHALAADRIQQIKQYIIEHSHEDISLDLLAEQIGLSPIYISKMFKEKLGVNYIEFLTACRIDHAKKLMHNQAMSIKEICYEIGYHDPNYFSKVFKRLTGVSPKTYREKLIASNRS